MKKTYIFIPPVKKATGGITVLCRIATILHEAGYDVFLVPRESRGWKPGELKNEAPTVMWKDLRLTPDDIWLVPEGWINALTPGLHAGAKCVVYCQNWAYLLSALPEGVSWNSLPVSFIAVSQPVAWFIEQTLGQKPPILRPGIDTTLFSPPDKKKSGTINIAYMPRKNKALVSQIRSIFMARNGIKNREEVVFHEISGLDAAGVADVLKKSHIFLASGFPEGFSLPPLEAWPAVACQ
ncbi:hypothetical protein [Desulfovulcanus sp.]